jgi:hypothetical protein
LNGAVDIVTFLAVRELERTESFCIAEGMFIRPVTAAVKDFDATASHA